MAEVHVSKRYEVPGQTMWERIGDPGKLSEWRPAIETTEMLDGGKTRVDTMLVEGESQKRSSSKRSDITRTGSTRALCPSRTS